MEELDIRRITNEEDLGRAFKLREIVFIHEQGVSQEAEFDGLDDQCQHLLAVIGDRAVGTLRLRQIDAHLVKIERVVVSKDVRGRHIGVNLMKSALRLARDLNIKSVKLHAQTHALGFYSRLGFIAHGDIFDEDGIPHVAMLNDLA